MESDRMLFFAGHPQALGLYLCLEEQILCRVPEAVIKASKTQISFGNPRGFAFISFLPVRPAAMRPEAYITVSFGLGYRKQSHRIDGAVEPYPGRWTHHVMISSPEVLDEELLNWIAEAAAFSAAKRKESLTQTPASG